MTAGMLEATQELFIALLLDETRELPAGWEGRRMAIYRNAYRARLVDALRETYPRTARWVGEAAFRRAAAHHAIQSPPVSWTLDAVGEGFAGTLADLFQRDPEVSELAWLEWAMHCCFVSADAAPLNAAGLQEATAGFREEDWALMRLVCMPGTQLATITHRVDKLWRALADEAPDPVSAEADYRSDEPLSCAVWRQGYTPVCRALPAREGQALAMMLAGGGYGELCTMLVEALGEEAAVAEAGAMLGRWLHEGMIAGVSLGS